ncbi:hypothetical protein [Nocardioides allogilvus]|uniref:hypothetical protein n=1 Tax=Nocardioides allogilvus TaxID=2072017 RepID=UPI0013003E34|nr:hypothetical protein [Nocardioides allogilvus]
MEKFAAVLSLVGSLAMVPAAAAGAPGPASFDGSCSLTGVLRFEPGLGAAMATTTAIARASGECSGVLTKSNGETVTLNDESATYRGRASGEQSCAAGTTRGVSRLRIAGQTVRFTLSETRVGVLAVIRLRDATGATTTGLAAVAPSEESINQAMACSSTAGLTRVPVTISTTS